MRVAVVVPWRAGCEHREAAWGWLRDRYAQVRPDWEVLEARGGDPWVKAEAVMPAISRCSADVVIVADADVWTDGLAAAVDDVSDGAAWAVPHRGVHRLSAVGTTRVLAGEDWRQVELDERAYLGVLGGGVVVASRETLLAVPMDPRFVGWGQEDESWGVALATMLGTPARGRAALVHLWHPPQPRLTRRRGSVAAWELYRRYLRAADDPRAMRALLNEATIPEEAAA